MNLSIHNNWCMSAKEIKEQPAVKYKNIDTTTSDNDFISRKTELKKNILVKIILMHCPILQF